MNTCSDRDSAREGEQDGRDNSSHCQGEGGETRNHEEAALRVLFMTEQAKHREGGSIFFI